MNKKLMAVAVAGALAAPAAAFAQASSVQIYGRANLGLDTYQATGATAGSASDLKSRTRVYDAASRLGVRGTEDLGGGLKAIFVMESGVNMDAGGTTGQGGQANASSGTLASRDSWLGLEGAWGRVSFGRQSIYWVDGVIAQSGPNYINTDIPWFNGTGMGRVSTGVPGGNAAGPVARQSNVMAYNSPTVSGWNATVSYAPQSENAAAAANTDATIWGVTVRYSGPIDFQFDHVDNQAVSGGANRQKSTGNKIGLSWPYQPGGRVSLKWAQTKMNDVGLVAGFSALHDNISQSMWGINWEHMIGNVQLMAEWSKLQKASGCSGTGCDGTDATGYMLGVKYYFSKRTGIYASYNQVRNGSNQIADYTAAAMTSVAAGTVAAGADPRIVAVGVMHNF